MGYLTEGISVIFYDFKKKWLLTPHSLTIPIFPFSTIICSSILRHKRYQ